MKLLKENRKSPLKIHGTRIIRPQRERDKLVVSPLSI